MSTDLSLREYVDALVEQLFLGERLSFERLRRVVGQEGCFLKLDDEIVRVQFEADGTFRSKGAKRLPTEGAFGVTSTSTVLALMRGDCELADAILAGMIDARGTVDQITAIALAIEIAIDTATRVPGLVALARQFRERRTKHAAPRNAEPCDRAAEAVRRQEEMLRRLDLVT